MRDLRLSAGRVLPSHYLSLRYARGGGPGGQNVNKVATKVDLRLDLTAATELLGADAVARIRAKLATRLDADGQLQIVSNEHRSQGQNLEAALARMEALLIAAMARPKPRRATRPTKGSVERRLDEKRRRGDVKRHRRPDGSE